MSLLTEVQQLVDETSGPVFWVIEQVYDALNTAIEDTWLNVKQWNYMTTPFVISSGADLVALATTSIMIPQYILDTASNKIFPTTHAMLEDWSANWHNTTAARPAWIVVWDAFTLRVFPRADAAYTYTVCGVPWPTEISGTSTDITCDPLIKQAIIHRGAANLLELTQPDLADHHEGLALEFERLFARQVRNQGGHNTLRLAPGKGWQVGMFGDIRIARKYN